MMQNFKRQRQIFSDREDTLSRPKKNIAILMHGLIGSTNKYGTGESVDISLSHKHFVDQIRDVNPNCEIDIFAHSWSTEYQSLIENLYSPKSILFEEQIHFDFEYIVGDPNLPMNAGRTENGTFKGIENIRFHSLFSRWYSAKIANELMNKYVDLTGKKYDYVMLTRFDLAYLVPIDFASLDHNSLHIIPPISNHGIHDLFFIGNQDTISVVCKMFDFVSLIKHFPSWNAHSHYLTAVWLNSKIGLENIKFFGPERLWDAGFEGAKTGPAPLVRDHYGLHKINQSDPLELNQIEKMRSFVINQARQYSNMILEINDKNNIL